MSASGEVETWGAALDKVEAARERWKMERTSAEAADAVDEAIAEMIVRRVAARSAAQHALDRLDKALREGCAKHDVFEILGVLGPAWEARQALEIADPTGYITGR